MSTIKHGTTSLLLLPLELHSIIYSFISEDTSSAYAFVATCRQFYRTFRFQYLQALLSEPAENFTVVCLLNTMEFPTVDSPARIIGSYRPLVIVGASLERAKDSSQHLIVKVFEAPFLQTERDDMHRPGNVWIVDKDNLRVVRGEQSGHYAYPWLEGSDGVVLGLDWDRDLFNPSNPSRENPLVRATAKMLRDHFDCRECENRRMISLWEREAEVLDMVYRHNSGDSAPCPICIGEFISHDGGDLANDACETGDWVPWKNYMKELGMDQPPNQSSGLFTAISEGWERISRFGIE